MPDRDQPDSRFAAYLIPPYRVANMVAEIHKVIHKQFGFMAADQFQVHATIKGFFKKTDGPLEPLIERLDAALEDQRPFPVHFNGYHIADIGFGLDVSRLGEEVNPGMLELRERVVSAVKPFIAPDCDFVEKDLGEPFMAHITLAVRDIPFDMQADVIRYLDEAPKPIEPFMADTLHLLEFYSQDWAGAWEKTLSWRLIKTWHTD